MYGIIYCAINRINGKVYIGQTIETLERRIIKHKSQAIKNKNIYFYNAI